MRALHQGIQRRAELIAEVNSVLDVLLFVAVHPRLGDGVVGVRGVDGEALAGRCRSAPSARTARPPARGRRSADVAAVVGHAAERHAQNRGDVVLSGYPSGSGCHRPRPAHSADARMTGTADRERAAVGVILLDGLVGQLAQSGCS